ncbi:hypothetical protein [Streptomyces sp. NBC_00572]|uniref:hypothetical protein n=1 Tax=Streptomyces sp. NBC_00572 TaxID=2903664 RepID=UPI002257FE64|nr:hypothetical protein [Streptomyces sp. NBC_00572]MCX4981306.1 hypothetical protein [Streptomyces sp. NBC_00572]
MKADQRGGTAPWAKALGAVLLVPVLALVALYAVGRFREAARERDAFDATRADARGFADALVAAKGVTPTDQDVRDVLDTAAAGRRGVLYEVRATADGTRVLVQFSRPYERGVALFGPADAMADRCFTVGLPSPASGPPRAEVTAHGPEDSCADVAGRLPSP